MEKGEGAPVPDRYKCDGARTGECEGRDGRERPRSVIGSKAESVL